MQSLVSSISAVLVTALTVGCVPSGCAPAASTPPPSPVFEIPPHLLGLARLVGGEWEMVMDSGRGMRDRWSWGAGNQSLRLLTHGTSAAGDPWRALQTIYWHPARKQLRVLGFNPFSQSVEEGALTLTPAGTEAIVDLYQVGRRRVILHRRTFNGPDRKRIELLEANARGEFEPLVAWDYTRIAADTPVPSLSPAERPPFPSRLKPLEFLHGRTWDSVGVASGSWASDNSRTRIAVDWIPYADILSARIERLDHADHITPLADLTLYRHTGTGSLRCFAISRDGVIYEGDLTATGDSIEGDLAMASDSGLVTLRIRLDHDGSKAIGDIRLRIWSMMAGERTLLLDARHHAQPA